MTHEEALAKAQFAYTSVPINMNGFTEMEAGIAAYLEARGAILCEKKISVLLYGEGQGLTPLHAPLKAEGGTDGHSS